MVLLVHSVHTFLGQLTDEAGNDLNKAYDGNL